MDYIHNLTKTEFENKYWGGNYNEPWISYTEEGTGSDVEGCITVNSADDESYIGDYFLTSKCNSITDVLEVTGKADFTNEKGVVIHLHNYSICNGDYNFTSIEPFCLAYTGKLGLDNNIWFENCTFGLKKKPKNIIYNKTWYLKDQNIQNIQKPLTFTFLEDGEVKLTDYASYHPGTIVHKVGGIGMYIAWEYGTTSNCFKVSSGDVIEFYTRTPNIGAHGFENLPLCNVSGNLGSLTAHSKFFKKAEYDLTYDGDHYGACGLFNVGELEGEDQLIKDVSQLYIPKGLYCGWMFDCQDITTAPVLRDDVLFLSQYAYMFYNCSNLNYIKCLATDISAPYCLENGVYGVAEEGTFVKKRGVEWPTGPSGIPEGGTVIEVDE